MPAQLRKFAPTLLVIIILLGYWVGSEIYHARSISPSGISTVADFFQRFGEPRFIRPVHREGNTYYELGGRAPSPSLFVFPSSAPAYIFDEQGRFVEWCSDPGDTPSYRQRWPLTDTNKIEPATFKEKFGI
jgi:hypothetical protein